MQGNDAIKNATSILDYIFRELAISYLGRNDLAHVAPEEIGATVLGGGVGQDKAPRRRARRAVISNGLVRSKPGDKLMLVRGGDRRRSADRAGGRRLGRRAAMCRARPR